MNALARRYVLSLSCPDRVGIVAAVVTETGGLLSHAALVSREYGIPAVLAAKGATTRIKEGTIITVDGGAGIVELSTNAESS